MNQSHDEPLEPVGFSSSDSVIIVLDGPGDTTVRPLRPVLKKLADAERERVRRWEEYLANRPKENDPQQS